MGGLSWSSNAARLQSLLSSCVNYVVRWMLSNGLVLNISKREVLWCWNSRGQHHIPDCPVIVSIDAALPCHGVINLGINME